MNPIKRVTAVLLLICNMFMLVSCGIKTGEPVPLVPFTGSVFDYEYQLEEGRDRDWEKDVVFFAHTFFYGVQGHPLLVDRECDTYAENTYMGGGGSFKKVVYYDEALRASFITGVNDLIARIPQLEDFEIPYKLAELVASLGDVHSNISVPAGDIFPFYFIPFFGDEGFAYYNVRAPKELERTLACELVAINGVAIDEILRRFEKLIPHENEQYLILNAVDVRYDGLCYRKEALQFVDVIGKNKDAAKFTFIDAQGKRFSVKVEAVTQDEYEAMETVQCMVDKEKLLMYAHEDQYGWYEYLPEDAMMYLRHSDCTEEGLLFKQFQMGFIEALQQTPGVEKLVIDLRGNQGGYVPEYYDTFIRALNYNRDLVGTVYILIDGRSTSAATMLATLLKKHAENAVLVGEPAGQPPDFFGYALHYTLPNSGIGFRVSQAFSSMWPEYEADALLPDIYVYQTFEDYLNNRDTALETIIRY